MQSYAAVILIDDNFESQDIVDKIEILPYSNLININRIIDGSIRYEFKQNTSGNVSYGNTDEHFLAQFSVQNIGTKNKTLYIKNATISSIDYFFMDGNELLSSYKWDFANAQSPDHIFSRFPIVPISVKPGQTIRVLAEFSSDRVVIFNPTLLSFEKTAEILAFDNKFYGLFFLLMIVFLIIFILLATFKRSKIFFIYSALLISTIFYNLFLLNFIHFKFHNIGNQLYTQLLYVFLLFGVLFGIIFLARLYKIFKTAPTLYAFTTRFYFFIAFGGLSLFLFNMETAQQLTLILLVIANILMILILSISLIKNLEYSSLAIIWLVYQFAAMGVVLSLKGLLSYSDSYIYFLGTMSLVESIWFLMVLSIKTYSDASQKRIA